MGNSQLLQEAAFGKFKMEREKAKLINNPNKILILTSFALQINGDNKLFVFKFFSFA